MKRHSLLGGAILIVVFCGVAAHGQTAEEKPVEAFAQGVVFHDLNGNETLDEGERPLAGIRVSNGRDVVTTDGCGRYRLAVDDDTILFVLKPRGWRTPLSKSQLPRFYYVHKPKGSPQLEFSGVTPTGPLPESVDFPLYPQEEPGRFQVIVFADPQVSTQQDVDYLAHDVVEELMGTKAALGISLGDIVFDNLSLFGAEAQAVAVLGIPWYNVLGNHDSNYDAKQDGDSNETFERAFGPSYYSFDYGPVHFIVVDDVEWLIDLKTGKRDYRGGIGERQLAFIRNDLASVPENKLVVLLMHIPLVEVRQRQQVYRLIERRPWCISFSGHTHTHEHLFVTGKGGWGGPRPHHHIINATACGCWWRGRPDERGIPLATMSDGVPNGYSLITFNGNQYTLDYKAAGHDEQYQMRIHAPEALATAEAAKSSILVNVFNSSERSSVRMRVDQGEWIAVKQAWVEDPAYRAAHELDKQAPDELWLDLPKPSRSPHVYGGHLPAGLEIGTHVIQVETTDMHGRTFAARRLLRIVPSGGEGPGVKDQESGARDQGPGAGDQRPEARDQEPKVRDQGLGSGDKGSAVRSQRRGFRVQRRGLWGRGR